uniref:Ig-like domain-containing protein n=1 Tax=Periophthalmus magnuspinnatus TaxID=409849 RepID=A0A3B4AEN9_9GOBI
MFTSLSSTYSKLLFLLNISLTYRVTEGGVASLSCQYSVQRFGLSRVCWGRDCGTFWCSNILVQSDENGVISKVSDRYRLTGDVLDGEMDLDILDVRRSDSGPYCCRVDINGIFNDKKTIMNLRVVRGQRSHLSIQVHIKHSHLALNDLHFFSVFDSQVEESVPSLSVQINVPVLSLSLSILILLPKYLLFLLNTCFHHLNLDTLSRLYYFLCDFSFSEEPRHIIYEIRMRRPVQENIYTLD